MKRGGGGAFATRIESDGSLAHLEELGPLAGAGDVRLLAVKSLQSGSESSSGSGSEGSSSQSSSSSGLVCASGFVLSDDGSVCVGVESVASFLACPSGFERFSVGLGSSGWGCRRVLGEASVSYSCLEGVLRVSGDSRVCVWEVEVVETASASSSCSPKGAPVSCRYVDAGGAVRFGSLRYGCPQGFTLSGSSCSRSVSAERTAPPAAAYSCVSGVLVGSSCVEYAEAVRSCLAGWVLRASGLCERAVREPARSAQSTAPTTTTTTTTTTTATTGVVSSAASTTAVVVPPGVPRNVRVSLGVESASVSWDPPASDGGSPVDGYRLEFREGMNGVRLVEKLPVEARRRSFSNLKGGVSYYVRLWALNDAGKSPQVFKGMRPCSVGERVLVGPSYDYCLPVRYPLPPAPGSLGLTPGVGSLTASWGAPQPASGDAAVAGFELSWRRERGAAGSWSSVKLAGAGVSSHVITGLTGGVSYQVRVRSYSVRGESSFPWLKDGVPLVDRSCPSGSEPGFWRQVFDPAAGVCVEAPGEFTAVVDEGGGSGELAVSAKWSESGSSPRGGRGFSVLNPVSEYEVRWRRSGSSGAWTSVARRSDETRFRSSVYPFYSSSTFWEDVYVIKGLTNGVSYEVEVEARNAAGSSSAAVVSGVPCSARMKYDTTRSRCVGLPPEPAWVEVEPESDGDLDVEWWQQDSLPAATPIDGYRVVVPPQPRSSLNEVLRRLSLDWTFSYLPTAYELGARLYWEDWSWGSGLVRRYRHPYLGYWGLSRLPEGTENVREFYTSIRSSKYTRFGTLSSWGVPPYVVVYSYNAAGESRKFVVSVVSCEGNDDDDCLEWPPSAPLVCAEGTFVVQGLERCYVAPACAQGQVRPPGGGDCVAPGAPSVVSSEFMSPVLDVSAGPRAGTLDVKWEDGDFNNGGLALTGFLLRWRRLGGANTGWITASVPPTLPSERERTFRISGLAVGSRYAVGLAAVNAEGASGYVSGAAEPECGASYFFTPQRTFVPRRLTHIEGTGSCLYTPKPPTGLTVLSSSTALRVSWRQETWDNHYPVTGYKLRWRAGSTGAWTETTIPWTAGVDSVIPGPPRKDFAHTIRGLPVGSTFYEVQVAADNQIPDNQSRWVPVEVSNCLSGRVRFTASSGCSDFPVLPSSSSRVPALFLYPGSSGGSLVAVWWQNVKAYSPSSYKIQWKPDGSTAWSSTDLPASTTSVPLPADRTSAGWRLHSHELTGLDVCTHDVRIFASRGLPPRAETVSSAAISAAPRGAVVAPGRLERMAVFGTGGGLRVFWQRPECDGGAPLSYQLSWRPLSGVIQIPVGTATVTDDGNRFYRHNITGLTDGQRYRVTVTPENTPPGGTTNPGRPSSGQFVPDAADTPRSCEDRGHRYCWDPYDLPPEKHAILNEQVREGEALRVCTSSQDLVGAVSAAVAEWNSVHPGLFHFGGSVSTPAECGEASALTKGRPVLNNPRVGAAGFDIAVMDYRCVESSTANAHGQNCSGPASSCRAAAAATDVWQNCLLGAASEHDLCELGVAAGCAYLWEHYPRALDATYFHPHLVRGSVTRINTAETWVLAHELGHFLSLADYGRGCSRIPGLASSLYSYGRNLGDWETVVAEQPATPDVDCRSTTITSLDSENLHAIYHPQAFTGLELFTPKGSTKLHLKFGDPPTDLRGNETHVAYRYVVLHRPPKTSANAAPNAFTQLMHNGAPVVLTPEQVKVPEDRPDRRLLLTSVDLNDSAFSSLRVKEHEFVVVGVTRGDSKRDSSKPLNPVSAAGLDHAVMRLNLGSAGVGDWTLGTPVSVTYP